MESKKALQIYLPRILMAAVDPIPASEWDAVQEIRLRADEPVAFSTPAGERYAVGGRLTATRSPQALFCDRTTLEQTFLRFCEESVYAHQEELRQGYLSAAGGIRVGVAGTAVTATGGIAAVRDVSSLCIRIPNRHPGCASDLFDCICKGKHIYSTILVGEPSGGKTTLLRDLAVQLASAGRRVAVVDERGELSGTDGLPGCDILRGYTKAAGIRQAVRTLAPEAVVFDEWGDETETEAIIGCANAGVAVIASLHGRDPQEILHRPAVRDLIGSRVFDRWVFLVGRSAPGRVKYRLTPEVKSGEIHWSVADRDGGERAGLLRLPSLVETGAVSCAGRAVVDDPPATPAIYGEAVGGVVAGVGGGWRGIF